MTVAAFLRDALLTRLENAVNEGGSLTAAVSEVALCCERLACF